MSNDSGASSRSDETQETADARQPVETTKTLVKRIMALRVIRVFQRYTNTGGPLLAAGLSYRAIFAVFAALWVGFSVAGFALRANPRLQQTFFHAIDNFVPGLVGSEGAVDPDVLLSVPVLGWTGALALAGTVWTMLGWFAGARTAIRRMFDVGRDTTFIVLLKLKDLGLAIGFSIALLISSGLTGVITTTMTSVFDVIGIRGESPFTLIVGQAIGLVIIFIFDTAVLAAFYLVLAGLRIPVRRLFAGAMLGAIGLGILKVVWGTLIGGASKNPLLASFAVIIGLLIWFNLICQVLLIAASWISVGMSDAGLGVRRISREQEEAEERLRVAEARLVVAVSERERAASACEEHSGFGRRRLAKRLKRAETIETEARRARDAAESEAGASR